MFVFPNDFDNNLYMLFFKFIFNEIDEEQLLVIAGYPIDGKYVFIGFISPIYLNGEK